MKILKDKRGGTAIEYALIAGLVSLAIVAACLSLGSNLRDIYTSVNTLLVGAAANSSGS